MSWSSSGSQKNSTTELRSWSIPLLLAFLTAAGAVLRLYRLGTFGFWRDEAQGVFIALKPFPVDIVRALILDGHPPVLYFLSHFWIRFAGRGELGIRLLAAITGIITIPLLFMLGRELFDRRVGLLAAAIGAALPLHVSVSREIRMYSVLALLITLSMLFLHRAWAHERRRDWAGYILAAILALYTHNFAALVIAAQGLWAIFRMAWAPDERSRFRAWLIAEVAIGGSYLLWLPVVVEQNRHLVISGSWLAQNSRIGNLFRLTNEMTGLAFFGGRYYLWLLLFFLGAFTWDWSRDAVSFRLDLKPATTLMLACIGVPFLLMVTLPGSGLGIIPAYTTMAMYPVVCLLLARGVVGLRFRPLMLIAGAIMALLWWRGLTPMFAQPVSSLREIAHHVERYSHPNDAIVIAPDYLATTFNYYFPGEQPQVAFPNEPGRRVEDIIWTDYDRRWEEATITPTLQFVERTIRQSGRAWLIAPLDAYPNNPRFDAIRAIAAALDEHYVLCSDNRSFHGPVEQADVLLFARTEAGCPDTELDGS